MKPAHVKGEKRGEILLYALSTCVWCKKTKEYLAKLGVAFDYIDVDLLEGEEREVVRRQMKKWNPALSFPTVVLDNKEAVNGYAPQELKERLGL